MEADPDPELEAEERAIYGIMLATAMPILIALLWQRRLIDGGNLLALFLIVLGLAGLIGPRVFRPRARLPRARVVRR